MNSLLKKNVISSKEITMASIADKARKAKNLATETFGSVSLSKTKKLANQNAKAAGKKLTPSEENRAAKIMQTRRQNDRDRTAARGASIEKMQAKKATAKRMVAAVAGAPAAKNVAPKPAVKSRLKATTKKKGM
jgi:hypothetical protein